MLNLIRLLFFQMTWQRRGWDGVSTVLFILSLCLNLSSVLRLFSNSISFILFDEHYQQIADKLGSLHALNRNLNADAECP